MKIEQANKLINKHENEDIPKINSQLEQKTDKIYVDTKIGNMGNTKTFKGSCLYSTLPISANVDDYWYVSDRATNYCWNGTSWVDIGNNLNIGDNTISVEKTDFFKRVNLLNKNNLILGKRYDGNVGNMAYEVTDTTKNCIKEINIKNGDKFICNFLGEVLFLSVTGGILYKIASVNKYQEYTVPSTEFNIVKCVINFPSGYNVDTLMFVKNREMPKDYYAFNEYETNITQLNNLDKFTRGALAKPNILNLSNIVQGKNQGGTIGESIYDVSDTSRNTVKNIEVINGDKYITNGYCDVFFLSDTNQILAKETTVEKNKEYTVPTTSERIVKCNIVYPVGYDLNTIMFMKNYKMTDYYIGYGEYDISLGKLNAIEERVKGLETDEKLQKAYILLNFDNSDSYTNVYPILKPYKYPFSFPADITEENKEGIYELLRLGNDLGTYSNKGVPTSNINATDEASKLEWYNYVKSARERQEAYGMYNPTAWFARQNATGSALEYAVKENGYKMLRATTGQLIDYRNKPYIFSCFGIYQASQLETIKTAIEQAISEKKAICILTHKLVDTEEENRGYDCLKSVYIELLDFIKAKTDNNECEVITFRKLYEIIDKDSAYENDYNRLLKMSIPK